MTQRDRLLNIPASALATAATPERVERVWKRIEGDIGSVGQSRSRRVPDWVVGAAVAGVILFPTGVFMGRAIPTTTGPKVVVGQEPLHRAEPAADTDDSSPVIEPEPRDSKEQENERNISPRQPQRGAERVVDEPETSSVEAVEPAPVVRPPEWYRLWNEDDYEEARAAIERQGGFHAALEQASADQAMAMADLARFSHETALAIAALRHVVNRFPNDPNAPIAAFSLGDMLDRAGDKKGAAEAYASYRALSPRGDFSEDALVRQIEAALEQRDSNRARELLTQYDEEFPNSSRLEELRAQLREVEETSAAGATPAARANRPTPAKSGESEEPTSTSEAGPSPPPSSDDGS